MVEKCLVVQHVISGKTVRMHLCTMCSLLAICRPPAYIPAAALLATEGCDVAQVEVKRAVKKEDMAAGAGYDQSYAARTGKAPDWHCPECRNKNFGWREVCNRCQVRVLSSVLYHDL